MSDHHDANGSTADKAPTDRIDGIWWGGAFIWGAVVLLLSKVGGQSAAPWWDSWGVFFIGLGTIALICATARLLLPKYRAKWLSALFFGVLFLTIGLGAWDMGWWPWVVVLLVGGAMMLRFAFRHET